LIFSQHIRRLHGALVTWSGGSRQAATGMKNFPHQAATLERLSSGLAVFAGLAAAEARIQDDGVVGEALARAGVYNFRNSAGRDIESLLTAERQKPASDQGTRTCARDLRRTYELLRFLQRDAVSGLKLTATGKRLVALIEQGGASSTSAPVLGLWRQSLDNLELRDEDGVSHPYRILLRLIRERPRLPGSHLGLCLEAKDDSEQEFDRILDAARETDADAMWQRLGVSKSMADNSRKILPALARQLNDIAETDDAYTVTRVGATLVADPPSIDPARARMRRREYDPSTRRYEGDPADESAPTRSELRAFDPDLLLARCSDHEACLRRFADAVGSTNKRFEGLYDLVVTAENRGLLVEVKTIRSDEARQVRAAIGQLLYYQHVEAEPSFPGVVFRLLLVTDGVVAADLVALLERHQIGLIVLPATGSAQVSPMGREALNSLGINI
jgi:hypothetical protein